jgi:hypothetical protein
MYRMKKRKTARVPEKTQVHVREMVVRHAMMVSNAKAGFTVLQYRSKNMANESRCMGGQMRQRLGRTRAPNDNGPQTYRTNHCHDGVEGNGIQAAHCKLPLADWNCQLREVVTLFPIRVKAQVGEQLGLLLGMFLDLSLETKVGLLLLKHRTVLVCDFHSFWVNVAMGRAMDTSATGAGKRMIPVAGETMPCKKLRRGAPPMAQWPDDNDLW